PYTQVGDEISRFKINLQELPGATREDVTMAWWAKFPEAWKASTENAVEPQEAMSQFAHWLGALPGRPKLIGWPLPVDFMFLYWYYVKFVGDPPFGYDGIDIKTYAMALTQTATLSEVSRTKVREALAIPD